MTANAAGRALGFQENLELYKRELAEGRVIMRSMPVYAGLVLTTRCHLRCIMCERVKKNKDLPQGYWQKVRPLLPYLTDLNWQGGEAFFVEEFRGYFEEAARQPNLWQDITTSGTLVDRDWARLLAASKVHLTFSIDTAVPATYESIRQGARWESVLASLAYLREAAAGQEDPPKRLLHAVIMNENREEVESVLDFALAQGFYMLVLSPCLPFDDPKFFLSPERFTQESAAVARLEGRLAAMRERAARAGIRFVEKLSTLIDSRRRPVSPNDGAQRVESPASSRRDSGRSCHMPWQGLFVNAELDGGIFPDCFCYETPVGNIADTSLVEAWNNERMQEYRRRVLERRLEGWCNSDCVSGRIDPREHFRHPEFLSLNTSPSGTRD